MSGFIWKITAITLYSLADIQKHATTKSQLEAQELENKNVKDVNFSLEISTRGICNDIIFDAGIRSC